MYVLNGIAYAGEPSQGMRVEEAKVTGDLCMLVRFSTGEVRLFDASPLVGTEAFAPLADNSVFEGYAVDHGVLSWRDGEIDIAPEAVYDMSYRYELTELI